MRLYYTISSGEGNIQTRPDLSLGGFRSGTAVPNGRQGNLFGDISCYSVRENQEEYIGLILRNEIGAEATDIEVFFTPPVDSQKNIEFAVVVPNANGEIERISDPFSRPFVADFNEANGEPNAINIGNLADQASLGVWFKKIINKQVLLDLEGSESLLDNGNPVEADEDIGLTIRWT